MAERKATSARQVKRGKAKAQEPKPAKKRRTTRRKRAAPKQAAAAAEQAVKRAKDGEAVSEGGKGLTMAKRRLRDTAVVARLAAGWTQEMVAEEMKISVRQVQRIEKDRGRMPSGLDERPMELLEELLRGFRSDIADGEAMAAYFADDHPSAAIGAKRLARESRLSYAELLMALGKLPENLELFRSEAVMQRIAEEMVGQLEALVREEVEADEVLAFFRGLLPQRTPELMPG